MDKHVARVGNSTNAYRNLFEKLAEILFWCLITR